jgi:hypothetical protein
MKYARIKDGKVIETINFNPFGKFHASLQWQEIPVEVEQNWTTDDGDVFVPPIDEDPPKLPDPDPDPAPVLSVIEMKLCFTSAERIAIYALKDAGDAVVSDWLSILDDPRAEKVDLGLHGIQYGVNYFIGKIPQFDEVRASEVLAGKLI